MRKLCRRPVPAFIGVPRVSLLPEMKKAVDRTETHGLQLKGLFHTLRAKNVHLRDIKLF